jgi:hypothetical protein
MKEGEAPFSETTRPYPRVFFIQTANPLPRSFDQVDITRLVFRRGIHVIGHQGKGKTRVGVAQVMLFQLRHQRIDLIQSREHGRDDNHGRTLLWYAPAEIHTRLALRLDDLSDRPIDQLHSDR